MSKNRSFFDVFKAFLEILSLKAQGGFEEDQNQSDPEKELKNPYKWLLNEMKDEKSTRVEKLKKSTDLDPGKIYIFQYDAITADRLAYWDKMPIMLMLGRYISPNGSLLYKGINISWYPPKYRDMIVNKLRKGYSGMYKDAIKKKPQKASEQASIDNLDLFAIRTALDPMGFSFAIRNYLPQQIQDPIYCVCYDDWDKILKIDQPTQYPQLEGNTSIFDIYKAYEDYVIKWNENPQYYKAKIELAEKQGKHKFIK
jgi:hypothetical protein